MRRALLSLVPSGVVGALAITLGVTDSWSRVGVPVGDRNFGDLNVIMAAAECARRDLSWTMATEPCQPGMAHYNYPSIWAKAFGLLGADPTWTPWIAALLVALFLTALVPLTWLAIGRTASWTRTLVMTLASLTPPVWLAFQRGNVDQAMFVLVVLALVLWLRGATRSAGVTLGVATALKLFPVGGALLLLDRQRPRRWALVTFAITTALGLVLVVRDLPLISERTPQIDGASFGIGLLPLLAANRLGFDTGTTVPRLAGLIAFALVTVLLLVLLATLRRSRVVQGWDSLCAHLRGDAAAGGAALLGAGVFLVAYLLGPSYDYRLIFLLPVVAALLRVESRTSAVAIVVLIAQLALSYSTFVGPAEYLSDLMLVVVAPLLAIGAWRVLRPEPDPRMSS